MTEATPQSSEEEEIRADARRERRLISQALLSIGIVVVIVIVRELLLR
ncbi:hypothetical protein [Microbacterium foliorum]|jgi:hypothetical protein|nr:hypothetical protein [Microbacterium foliorum]CAH0209853.1 hypothetical protein SRABI03_02199 [Microbacterium foliorum]CAH0220271.1 hypothetical protein SRABI44_02396 [Microbacterium foliorum]